MSNPRTKGAAPLGAVIVCRKGRTVEVNAVGLTPIALRALVQQDLDLQGGDEPHIAGKPMPDTYKLKDGDVVSYYPK